MHCLPSDRNVIKERMDFIFNEDPDHISKNLVFCSLHFTADSFTNKAQFDAVFSERVKLKDDAVPTILDLTVMLQHTSVSICLLHDHYCFVSSFVWGSCGLMDRESDL